MGLTQHGDTIWYSPKHALLEQENNINIYPQNEAVIFCKIISDPDKSPIFDKAYPEIYLKEKAFTRY